MRFRTLLWALYAFPHEIAKLYAPNADIDLLANIASVAQKYTFEKVESWAADLIMTKLQSRERQYPANHDFLPMLQYAASSKKAALRDKILDAIRGLLSADTIDFTHIIRFVDEDYGSWDDLLGLTLYQYAIKGPHRWEADGDKLPKDKRILLYVAFGKLCDMRVSGVPWEHVSGCADTKQCVAEFRERLTNQKCVSQYTGGQADFIAWTRHVALMYLQGHDDCLDAGIIAMQAQARKLEERPWIFFSELKC